VGGPYAEPALRSIAWEGRFLVVGFAAGNIPKVPLNLVLLKGCDVVGVFWGAWTKNNPKGQLENMAQILRWAAEGKLSSHVHAVYPLEKTPEAIKSLSDRKVMGKVLLRP
ncbi:MAG TPA: zinc-binding dehydrogenase, partial [Xanthobacteraceae bacterium]|nr:zinc-binding dehydrogenase [Xanthobacteraceae bacterium]